jgi:membrane-bound ClpP family serine protease
MIRRLAFLVALLAGLWPASSDTIVLHDGRRFEGKLLSQTSQKVSFLVERQGIRMTWNFKPSEIKSITVSEDPPASGPDQAPDGQGRDGSDDPNPAAQAQFPKAPKVPEIRTIKGPSYYRIPLEGVVGEALLASTLRRGLEDALRREPSVVLLEIRSPGGKVKEVARLAKVIDAYDKKLRLVVWVEDALSAAAITSLACDEIYMKPSARIGAAKAIRITSGGVEAVEEKIQSAWRAQARATAEMGGHNPLLAQAMIDAGLELHWDRVGASPVVREGPGPNMLTRKDRLMTLTASEALQCGLSKGTAKDLDELAEALGLKGWRRIEGYAEPLAAWHKAVLARFAREMDTQALRFSKAMKAASQSAPWQYKAYKLWAGGDRRGQFTPESRQVWQKRSLACMRSLLRAQEALDAATALVDALPEDLARAKADERGFLLERRENLKKMRLKMYRNMQVQGPGDIKE